MTNVTGIPLSIREQELGKHVHIKCNFLPEGIPYSRIEWFKDSTSNRIYYDDGGSKIPEGDLAARDCTTTHENSTFGLIINNTIPSDDAVYIGKYTQSQGLECTVSFLSRSEYNFHDNKPIIKKRISRVIKN